MTIIVVERKLNAVLYHDADCNTLTLVILFITRQNTPWYSLLNTPDHLNWLATGGYLGCSITQ